MAQYINATDIKTKKCKFINSNFSNSYFNNSILIRIELEGNDFREAWFNGVELKNIDFSSCNIDGIKVDIEDIEGVKVNMAQAIELIRLLKVQIL